MSITTMKNNINKDKTSNLENKVLIGLQEQGSVWTVCKTLYTSIFIQDFLFYSMQPITLLVGILW